MKTQRLDLSLTVLSPVHIGSGVVIDPTQYVITSDRFWRIDPRRFAAGLTADQNSQLDAAITSGQLSQVWRVISSAFKPDAHGLYGAAAGPGVHSKYAEGLKRTDTQLEVHECIKEHGRHRPIIPGSTLKGALRTAILHGRTSHPAHPEVVERLMEKWKRTQPDHKGRIKKFPETVDERHEPALLEGALLGALDRDNNRFAIDRDPFSLISVPDVTLDAACLELAIATPVKHPSGEPGGPPLLLEIIRPGTTGTVAVTYDERFFQRAAIKSIQYLLECAHCFFSSSVETEIGRADVQDTLANSLREYCATPALLRLGGHIGRYSFALDLSDRGLELPDPKTHCIVETSAGRNIMGIVRLESR